VGGADSEQRIKDGLARGADSAVRLDDPAFAGSDALGIARILAAAAKKAGVGLLLCGKQAIDGDSSQVPGMVAELLDWPQITDISNLDLDGDSARAHRAAGAGNKDVIQATLPVVLSCDKGLNTPRFASLRGIMMAKRKKIEVWGAEDLGVDPGSVGAVAALLVEQSMSLPPSRPSGRMIEGASVGEKVNELVRLLREEAKVL
jgi:electron transfer flavoprotein beta subunit